MPSAFRNSASTTEIFRKEVPSITSNGNTDNRKRKTISWTGRSSRFITVIRPFRFERIILYRLLNRLLLWLWEISVLLRLRFQTHHLGNLRAETLAHSNQFCRCDQLSLRADANVGRGLEGCLQYISGLQISQLDNGVVMRPISNTSVTGRSPTAGSGIHWAVSEAIPGSSSKSVMMRSTSK